MRLLDDTAKDTQEQYDIVVVGSGAAAFMTVATAAYNGLKVMVLERSEFLGGTSAVSGGMLWIVGNYYAQEARFDDSIADDRVYVEAVSRSRGRVELLDATLNHGPEMLRFMAEQLGVRFIFLQDFPDHRMDLPGAIAGGRTIEADLFNYGKALGELAPWVRTDGRHPCTMQEYEEYGAFTKFPWDELQVVKMPALRPRTCFGCNARSRMPKIWCHFCV